MNRNYALSARVPDLPLPLSSYPFLKLQIATVGAVRGSLTAPLSLSLDSISRFDRIERMEKRKRDGICELELLERRSEAD